MANRPAKITQTEIKRTLQAAAEAGVDVGGFTVNHVTGEVVVFVKGADRAQGTAEIDRMLGIQ